MQGCEAQAEHPALTNAEQVECLESPDLQYLVDAASELILQVVLEGGETICTVGVAPVDQIHVQTARQEPADERAIRLEVHHVGSVHKRINDEQRNGSRVGRDRAIAIQTRLSRSPHLVLLGTP